MVKEWVEKRNAGYERLPSQLPQMDAQNPMTRMPSRRGVVGRTGSSIAQRS
jgi:hypothetical protein